MYSHFAYKSSVTYLEECLWLDSVDVPSLGHEHLWGMGLISALTELPLSGGMDDGCSV